MTLAAAPKELIEQAIARGETTSQIMHRQNVDYATVQIVRDGMADPAIPDRVRMGEPIPCSTCGKQIRRDGISRHRSRQHGIQNRTYKLGRGAVA